MNTEEKNQNSQNQADLLKSIVMAKTMAKFSHAKEGALYYTVESLEGHTYIFPIDITNSEDVGTATFNNEEKASLFMRYIRKAIQNESLMKIR